MKAVFTLKSAESRRLIAKGLVEMPIVKEAWEKAYVLLAGGTTNAYVAQERMGTDEYRPELCTVGLSTNGVLCNTPLESRKFFPMVYKQGVPQEDMTLKDGLFDFYPETVVIKGANAIDPVGNVGIITSGFDGGTIPNIIVPVTSNGLRWICPVGLEKLVPSVKESCNAVGAKRIDISMGADFGMYHIATAIPFTEKEALKTLFNLETTLVAAGGIGGNQGSVVLAVEGEKEDVEACVEFIEKEVKGEPDVPGNKGNCEVCRYKRCRYCGMTEEQLPDWMK